MSVSRPTCPACDADLVLTHTGTFDSWACPAGHGIAMTLTEGYERLQEDELTGLWALARRAAAVPAARRSPISGRPMVAVEVPWDGDEVPDGATGDGPDLGSVWLDVDLDEQVVWLDSGELEVFPADLADPEPSPEELAKVEEIRAAFGQRVVEAEHSRQAQDLSERVYRRVVAHRGLSRVLTEVGSLGRR